MEDDGADAHGLHSAERQAECYRELANCDPECPRRISRQVASIPGGIEETAEVRVSYTYR